MIFKNGLIYTNKVFQPNDILAQNGVIINIGNSIEFSVWGLDKVTKIDANNFKSKGNFTPFDEKEVCWERQLTLIRGNRYENKR